VSGGAGQVRCDPGGGWPWPTHVEAGLGPEDQLLCEAQQLELRRLWGQFCDSAGIAGTPLSFGPVFGSPDLPGRLLAPRIARGPTAARTYSFPLGSEQHEAGTTPLGTVLDDNHQFREVPGLFAAGPSSFPRTGAANPAMTTLALAKRLAGKLAEAG